MIRNPFAFWVGAGLFMAAFSAPAETSSAVRARGPRTPGIFFNQQFIEGLYSQPHKGQIEEVFDLVFSHLAPEVTVYPTENYYYWSTTFGGKTIWGNLRLAASDRDRGIIHLGYFEFDDNGRFQDRFGTVKAFSAADGVTVEKIEPFLYSVTYKGKRVLFHLNDIGMEPPKLARLSKQEKFVGPIFDESGLKFFLLFNTAENHFFYVLNEEGPVAEELLEIGSDLVVGKRTGFVFYVDEKYNRKVLVAVHGRNSERNNYYDGPFDQLPDNYVEQTQIHLYMEAAYPNLKGLIDRFGSYLTQEGSRVAISPYQVYYHQKDLDFVASCLASGLSEAALYSCITPDFQQMYACGDLGSNLPCGPPPGPAITGEAELVGRVTDDSGEN